MDIQQDIIKRTRDIEGYEPLQVSDKIKPLVCPDLINKGRYKIGNHNFFQRMQDCLAVAVIMVLYGAVGQEAGDQDKKRYRIEGSPLKLRVCVKNSSCMVNHDTANRHEFRAVNPWYHFLLFHFHSHYLPDCQRQSDEKVSPVHSESQLLTTCIPDVRSDACRLRTRLP